MSTQCNLHLFINVLVHNGMIFCHFDDVSILILVLSSFFYGNAEGKMCFFSFVPLFFYINSINYQVVYFYRYQTGHCKKCGGLVIHGEKAPGSLCLSGLMRKARKWVR